MYCRQLGVWTVAGKLQHSARHYRLFVVVKKNTFLIIRLTGFLSLGFTIFRLSCTIYPGNKTGNVHVTLRRVRAAIVAVESITYYIFWVCVCSLTYLARNAHAPYCHLCHVRLNNIFYTLSHKRLRWSRGSVLAFSTKFAGSNPAEAVGFLGQKKFLRRGSKAFGPMS